MGFATFNYQYVHLHIVRDGLNLISLNFPVNLSIHFLLLE